MKKAMKNEIIRDIVGTVMASNIDGRTAPAFFEFSVGDTDLHLDGHYGHGGDTVYVMSAWLGEYTIDEEGNPYVPDDAPYIWREVARPVADGCWCVASDLVEQLVKDILRYV